MIARALQRAFPDEVWVSGEIRNLNRPASGHVYFTLVDADAGEPVPQLPVVLFAGDKEAVNRALVRVSAGRMVDGMQVRIRGTVGHQPGRGVVQLRMRWIDTEYTLGRLAAERRQVLERLAAAGLLDRQVSLPLPVAPRRIGLVTSVGSAAHADFLDELRHSGFGFVVMESHATVQGWAPPTRSSPPSPLWRRTGPTWSPWCVVAAPRPTSPCSTPNRSPGPWPPPHSPS